MGYQNEGMTDHEENINWDDVGKPVAIGEYDLEVTEANYKPTSTQKHMVNVQFKILAAYNEDNENAVGKMLFENFVFTQSAAFRVKAFSKASGVDLPAVISKNVLEQWANDIVGTQVGGAVGHRVWNDEPRASITKFFEFGSGGDVEDKSSKKKVEEDDDEEDEDEDEDKDDKKEELDGDEEETETPKVTSIKEAMDKKEAASPKKTSKKSSAR